MFFWKLRFRYGVNNCMIHYYSSNSSQDESDKPIDTKELNDGSKLEVWTYRRDKFDSQNNLINRYILTTVGRVVMNHTIIDSVSQT